MKESKFIELLNLYVDHQISPAEAELLESEVRINPAHRRIYREYCQMQKACDVLAENFRAQAPGTDAQLGQFRSRRGASTWTYAAGLLAAAACVALVLNVRGRFNEPLAVSTPISHQSATTPALKAPAVAVTPALAVRPALQPVFGPRLFALREQNAEGAEASAFDPSFAEWMNSIQLSSLSNASADDLRFDAHTSLQPDIRTYRAGRPVQGKFELTAFTFEK